MTKTFVLDTNVLLHNSTALESFADNHVVLPMAVIEELDNFKKNTDELGRNSRAVIRRLDAVREGGELGKGVPLANGGSLRVMLDGNLPPLADLTQDIPDNRILRAAMALFKQGEQVIFVSKDINARIKADALGITAQDFEKEKVNFDELYSGYREVSVTRSFIDGFYAGNFQLPEGAELNPNEFAILRDMANEKHSALARSNPQGGLMQLNPKFEHAWNIRARSKEQRMALELLMDDRVQLVTLVGQAGTGKTLLALAAGLEGVLKSRKYEKLLVSRPIVPMGQDIGFLPGSKDEKLSHWMQPIFDNLSYLFYEEGGVQENSARRRVEELQENGTIELEALTYIRGRSIPRQFVIVDEAQNLTPHEVKTIISRAGEGTKMVLTGDPYQIDNPYLDSASNGLSYAVERLKSQSIHGHVTLRKSERSPLAAVAAELL